MKNKNPTINEWLSLFAILISAIALIISAWQAFMFRTHNELSVRPLLDTEIQFVKKGYESLAWIALKNDGLGPAIIESNTIIYKNKEIDSNLFYKDFIVKLPCHRNSSLSLLQGEDVLKVGESIRVLMFDELNIREIRADPKKLKDEYKNFFSIEIKVNYRSLYGKKCTFSKKLGKIFPELSKEVGWTFD